MATSHHRLREFRIKHGLTLANIHDLTGVPAATVNRAERGTHEISALLKARIAKGLGVQIRDLFEVEES